MGHLPWLLILAPVIATPTALLTERAWRMRRARLRANALRDWLGTPRALLQPTLSDSSDEVTLTGELWSDDEDSSAMSWRPPHGEAVHISGDRRWVLRMDDARVVLDGPLDVLVGAEESVDGAPVSAAGDESEIPARIVRVGDAVRVRGRLLVEPAGAPLGSDTYRDREVTARLVPIDDAITVVAERAPRVALRPAMVRVARLTMTLSIAFAVVPALTVLILQWRTMQSDLVARAHCERDLATAIERHQPWDAADLAPTCGSMETEADAAWHHAELPVAARAYWRLRLDRADLEIHASNAASQIVAGRYDEAARVVNRMSMRSVTPAPLQCLAKGLRYMYAPTDELADELRAGAEHELQQIRSTTDDRPMTCTPILAEVVGDHGPLDRVIDATLHDGAAPGYFNSYLAALLAAERSGELDHPLLLHVLDARYPPLAVQKPSAWALHHPMALSTSLLRRTKVQPGNAQRVAAAFAAQKALFDAYLGEGDLAMAALMEVTAFARSPLTRPKREGHILLVGAAAALLVPDVQTARVLLDALGPEDPRAAAFRRRLETAVDAPNVAYQQLAILEAHRPSGSLWQTAEIGNAIASGNAVQAAPIAEIHGFVPYAREHLKRSDELVGWTNVEFVPLCETCGLRALAEHLAARRLLANAVAAPAAPRLAEPARRVHAAMLRRDVAVPLYLLERLVEADPAL